MKTSMMKTSMMMMMGLCCSGVLGASELAFSTEPRDVIAVRDRPLSSHCRVEGEGPITITWRHNGVPIETGVRSTVSENGTLFIRNFSKRRESNETDAGEYECAAQNRYGLSISRKARVQLASLPKFSSHPQSSAVDEGGVARLSCQVNGIPEANITWQKDRRPSSIVDPRYTSLPNGVLQITSVQRSDGGVFRCIASNIANTRFSHEAQLTVNVAGSRTYKEPVISSGPQNLTINVHQTAILECIATGNPRPIVSWSRLDGRSIGVEGVQVSGTGNLMISDATSQHSGVYVCSANRPGSRSRRTASGHLVVQAPPEFVQWPQSVSRPAGGSTVFSCMATGVPEPHLIWLKNGKSSTPSGNVKLTNGNTTLAITRIAPEDEAIYQCIAENSAGTNQASARLAIVQGPKSPEAPTGLRAAALSSTSSQSTWDRPEPEASQQIIGYVLHIRRSGEPDGAESQEAVDMNTFIHDVHNSEAATTYSIYSKAYSAQGGSQQSSTITATTSGGVPSTPNFFTKVLNQTAIQVYWELPSKPGKVEGYRSEYRGVSSPDVQGQELFPGHINTHTISNLEAGAVYEIQSVAFNGNGDSPSTRRSMSLSEGGASAAGGQSCNCDRSDPSMSTSSVGVHSGLACILCCSLFVSSGYRRSLICRKEASWETPPTLNGVRSPKGHTVETVESSQRSDSAPPPVMVMVQSTQPIESGTGTG